MCLYAFRKIFIKRKTDTSPPMGFTLVETMMSTLIFLFLITAIYAIASISQKYWDVNKAKNELHQELRKAMDNMINDLRQAGPASITDVPADGNEYPTITFKIPTGVTGGSLTWSTDSIQFVLAGPLSEQLHRIEGSDTKILALNVENVDFRRQASSPNILEVSLLGEKDTDKGLTVNYNLDFEVQLRN